MTLINSHDKNEVLLPRETGKLIAQNSRDVKIDSSCIEKTAIKLAELFAKGDSNWKKKTLHPDIADDKAVEFIFAMDTLNFCFWSGTTEEKYAVLYKGKSYTGYWALVAALKRAEEEGKTFCNARFMSSVDKEEFAHIFRSESKTDVPMLKERVEAVNDAGRVLLTKFDGSFVNCLRSCKKDAITLVKTVVNNFKSFRDEAEFNGQRISFYKRAQILVADIWCCFEGEGLGEFHNIDALTMFADYRVPQSLEYFGILCYSPNLKNILNKGNVLEPGCRYELEIRGCSIDAIERLQSEVRSVIQKQKIHENLLQTVNSVTVDNHLWDYAKLHAHEMSHLEFHRVRTIYY